MISYRLKSKVLIIGCIGCIGVYRGVGRITLCSRDPPPFIIHIHTLRKEKNEKKHPMNALIIPWSKLSARVNARSIPSCSVMQ